jgi:hypothetical protein
LRDGGVALAHRRRSATDKKMLRRSGTLAREAAMSLTGVASREDGKCDAAWTGELSSMMGTAGLLQPAGEEGVSGGGQL